MWPRGGLEEVSMGSLWDLYGVSLRSIGGLNGGLYGADANIKTTAATGGCTMWENYIWSRGGLARGGLYGVCMGS